MSQKVMAIPLPLVVLVFLFINLLLLFLLCRRLWVLYKQTKQRRQQRFTRRCEQFGLHPITSSDIVFLGDSITEGAEWSTLFPTHSVRNFGIGSDTTTGVLSRLGPITEGQPQAVFLMIGTNDIGLGLSQTETIQNYRAIVQRLRQEAPQTALYIQSILPRKAAQGAEVRALNQQLHELAQENQCTYIDLYSHYLDRNAPQAGANSTADHISSILSNDSLHLLGTGYGVWQEQLQPYMKGLVA